MNIHWLLCPTLLFGGIALYAFTVVLARRPVKFILTALNDNDTPNSDDVACWSALWPFGVVFMAPLVLLRVVWPFVYYPGLVGWKAANWVLNARRRAKLPRAKVVKE